MEILRRCRRRRRAFTLVEMLMVIVIIGILAALLLVAVNGARKAARNAVIKNDVSQLDMALENYRTEIGEYPPDFVGVNDSTAIVVNGVSTTVGQMARNAVLRHLRKRFPRFTIPDLVTGGDAFDNFVELVYRATTDQNQNGTGLCINFSKPRPSGESGDVAGLDVSASTPFQALVFWLGGLPTYAGSNQLTGFSANPVNPFQPSSVSSSRTRPMFEFDIRKLIVASDGTMGYGSTTSQGGSNLVAIAYFRPTGNPYDLTNWYLIALRDLSSTTARPYADSRTNNRWMSFERPQIISAGLDGSFGSVALGYSATNPTSNGLPHFPSGGNLPNDDTGAAHRDNITNFTGSAILQDEMQP